MQFAHVQGIRRQAEPGLFGSCPVCNSAMLAKCGERRIWHWAHKGARHCDHWWEPETEWHRSWKNKFPAEWQEVVHRAPDGEKHIADVKAACGRVIEFQHSFLNPSERRSREAFYKPILWVVNGLRRKRDRPNFYQALAQRSRLNAELLIYRVPPDACAILREWMESDVPVFFDFGVVQEDTAQFGTQLLWRLDPKSAGYTALLSPVPLDGFVEALNKGEPIKGFRAGRVATTSGAPARQMLPPPPPPYRPWRGPTSFAGYLARMNRRRARF